MLAGTPPVSIPPLPGVSPSVGAVVYFVVEQQATNRVRALGG